MIIIEGQIGVGKTTIGEILQNRYGVPLFRELTHQSTLQLLDRFYADKPRWAFTLQVHFLNERFRMIKDIFRNGGGLLAGSDRLLGGDLEHGGRGLIDAKDARLEIEKLEKR